MVSAVDETVGAIYDALEETGMLDNTLIAFSSDVSFLNYLPQWET